METPSTSHWHKHANMAGEIGEIGHASATTQARFLPVSCFIYKSQEAKPTDKWSTYIKIEEKDSYRNIKNRFCICDYGSLKKRATEHGIVKINITIGIKDKRVEPPGFPNGRLFTVSSEEEWTIHKGFLFGNDASNFELIGD